MLLKKPRFNLTTSLAEGLPYVGLTEQDVQDAHARLSRFAPYLAKHFLKRLPRGLLNQNWLLFLLCKTAGKGISTTDRRAIATKKDSHLPISGSIKARGGIYEVPAHAENWLWKRVC